MNIRECMAQALRELGSDEESIKASFDYADQMAGKLAARHEVSPDKEREAIDHYKEMYRIAIANPDLVQAEMERLKVVVEKEYSQN